MQNHMNLLYREEEREMVPLCMDMGVGIIPWSPLARGFLAGNRTREGWGVTVRAQKDNLAQDFFYTDTDFDIVDRVKEVAAEHGVKPAQIALAWLLHKPGVTSPIVGTSKMYQLEEAVAATSIELSEDEMRVLEGLYQPRRLMGYS
jgi:aryl-alcohol dehydrogenase (NADP+)